MGIEVANGGYVLDSQTTFINHPNSYFGPGKNVLNTITLNSSQADSIYVLFRTWWYSPNTGYHFQSNFESTPSDRFSVSVADATTGTSLITSLSTGNLINTDWNMTDISGAPDPYVLTINTRLNSEIVNLIDCKITDNEEDEEIIFRVVVENPSSSFGYLTIYNNINQKLQSESSLGSSGLVILSKWGSKTIIVPNASFIEVDKSISDFSYPSGKRYYQIHSNINYEDYDFTLQGSSPTIVSSNIDIFPLPGFNRVAILQIDGNLSKELSDLESFGYANIIATGKLTGISNNIRVYFVAKRSFVNLRGIS